MIEIKKELLPVSRAKNAYELLDEIVEAIEEEPMRLQMSYWIMSQDAIERHMPKAPACGTVCCVAGWAVTMRDGVDETKRLNAFNIASAVKNRAAELLGFNIGYCADSYDISDLFDGTVHNGYGDEINVGDSRYVPAVIERIREFQYRHEARLKAHIYEQ